MHPDTKECNQVLALSLNEKGNKRSRIASLETPFNFIVSHTSKKTEYLGLPREFRRTEIVSAGLSSKLLAAIIGRAMLDAIP